MSIIEYLPGDTMTMTWVFSGYDVSALEYAIRDSVETVVNTGSFVNSGNGHAYALVTVPNTPGYYVGEYNNVISGYPYKRRDTFRVQQIEVD